MGETTKIEWTQATWNPWQGCTKVSPGCDHCYAETLDKRWGRDFNKVRRSSDTTFYAPLRWKEPKLVFTCSMSDFFHRQADPWREEAWEIMRRTPHTYQVLTKRPGLAVDWYKKHGWLPNVWLGASVESQRYAPRLDVLARVPAPILFVSAEPLLGPLDLRSWMPGYWQAGSTHENPQYTERWDLDGSPVNPLYWVICGGESGTGARPMDLAWARDVVRQCQSAGVACFVKQLGSRWASLERNEWGYRNNPKGGDPAEWPYDLRVREMPPERRR